MRKRATRAEARDKRVRELGGFKTSVTEYMLAPEMDEDARALYWIGPWDFKRFLKDEKGKYIKDDSGNNKFELEREPQPAIHIYLAGFQFSPRALNRIQMGLFAAGAHRCLGYLDDKKLLTSRWVERNWHPRLHGWTVNLHILQNAERFGFEAIEVNGKLYSVENLLTCPEVSRKDSGGYEKNLLLIDPENKPSDPFSP